MQEREYEMWRGSRVTRKGIASAWEGIGMGLRVRMKGKEAGCGNLFYWNGVGVGRGNVLW